MAEAAAKKLINEPDNVVDEAIDGLVLTTPGVRRLEGYTVLVRENLDKSKVAVVSGGGSGHERIQTSFEKVTFRLALSTYRLCFVFPSLNTCFESRKPAKPAGW